MVPEGGAGEANGVYVGARPATPTVLRRVRNSWLCDRSMWTTPEPKAFLTQHHATPCHKRSYYSRAYLYATIGSTLARRLLPPRKPLRVNKHIKRSPLPRPSLNRTKHCATSPRAGGHFLGPCASLYRQMFPQGTLHRQNLFSKLSPSMHSCASLRNQHLVSMRSCASLHTQHIFSTQCPSSLHIRLLLNAPLLHTRPQPTSLL